MQNDCVRQGFVSHEDTDEWIRGYTAFVRGRRSNNYDFATEGKSRFYRKGYYCALREYGVLDRASIDANKEVSAILRDLREHKSKAKKMKALNAKLEPRLHSD